MASATGRLNHDRMILDSTSGNTGIAYAMIAAVKGYRVKLCLPANASMERKRILKAYGAEMVFTDPAEGSDGAIRKCREIYECRSRTATFIPTSTTIRPTGRRISRQPARRSSSRPAAASRISWRRMGTSGTFMGVTRRLRRDLPEVKCYSAQPSSGFHGLEGLKHMPTAIVPGIYDETLADGNLWIETEDAYRMVRRLAREEGLLVGISSGATSWRRSGWRRELARRGRDRRHRDHLLRQRRQISERTFLGRGMIRDRTEALGGRWWRMPARLIRTNAAAPCWARCE